MAIIFITASCATQDGKAGQTDNKFDTLPLPLDSMTFYFKTKSNWKDTTKDALDTFINTWYSKMLFALKEPILKDYYGDKEIYRFTWLRTFHHPVSVRLEKQGEVIKLFTKVSNGVGGYYAGQLFFDTTVNITTSQYNLLQQKVNKIGFWNLATEKRDEAGKDGSEWIIEVFKGNKYHMVTRWTPDIEQEENFRSVGEYLVSLSKIRKEETENFY